jgi:hypothetical protein
MRANQKRIADLALKSWLASMYTNREAVGAADSCPTGPIEWTATAVLPFTSINFSRAQA